MLLRRVIVDVCVLIGVLLVAVRPVSANPVSSDEMSQDILNECDARAMPFGMFDRKIADAAKGLTAMGVFEEEEFHNAKIGFCDLRRVGGPAATTSCAGDTILLDRGYAAKDQDLVLTATLAHEMKHYFQHSEQKAKFGDSYCLTQNYIEDKVWMEEEADAFGDAVAELFFTGRPVEIENQCPVVVSVYLEADNAISVKGESLGFIDVAPGTTVLSSERSMSRFFKFYAESSPAEGRKQVWRGSTMAHKRVINESVYGLRPVMLSNPFRSKGPFQMQLSCEAGDDRHLPSSGS